MRRDFVFLMVLASFCFRGFSQEVIRISGDLELVRLSENSFMHTSYVSSPDFGRYSCNGLIFINGREAFLFDTPPNDFLTAELVSWLKDHMDLRVTGFVPNHWHEDCMGGLGYLQGNRIESWANQLTIDIAKKNNLPVPEHGFRDSLTLMLGDKSIHCYYPGPAHSPDNIVVWIPSEKVLFPGCICKSLNATDIGNVADGEISAYPAAIDKILRKFRSAVIVIPGHGAPGGKDLLTHTRSLLKN